MIKFLVRRFLSVCFSLLAVMTLAFVLMKLIPGDPFQQEQALPAEIYQALRTYYGLNDPLPTQYVRYLGQLAAFDFGPSLIYKGRNVTQMIADAFPTSVLLGITALSLAIPSGIVLGVLAAIKKHRWQDSLLMVFAVIGISIPSFIIATLLQYVLGMRLGIFPIARLESFASTILPALSLAALPTAFIARLIRAKMIEELHQGYVVTARAKGLSEEAVIFRHVLRNSLIPVLSYLGPLIAGILTGSFIVEKIYSIPGLGYWFVTSVSNRDYPMIMGLTVFYCSVLLVATFLIDVVCLMVDPRLAAAEKERR